MSDETTNDGLKCGYCGVTWDGPEAFKAHFPCEEAKLAVKDASEEIVLEDADFLPVTEEVIEEAWFEGDKQITAPLNVLRSLIGKLISIDTPSIIIRRMVLGRTVD